MSDQDACDPQHDTSYTGQIATLATQLEQMRRERGEALAELRTTARELGEARAKLARIRSLATDRYDVSMTAYETLGHALRIIDEKEGGQ